MSTIPIEIRIALLFAIAVAPALIRAWDIGRMVADTLEECHVPPKVAADWMGIGAPQLSRALAGVGPEHLSADRLTNLTRAFWLALTIKISEHFGVIPPAETRAERLARVTCRAAKATLRRDVREEQKDVA